MSRRLVQIFAIALAALAALVATAAAVTAGNGSSVTAFAGVGPNKLSKSSFTPVRLKVGAKITAAGLPDSDPAAKLLIDFDKNGMFSAKGLPTCNAKAIEGDSIDTALEKCRTSVVGRGTVGALIVRYDEDGPLPPTPFDAKAVVFNGTPQGGKPTLLMYASTESPFPVSYIVTGVVTNHRKQGFGTRFELTLPKLFGGHGAVSDFNLTIGKTFRHKGRKHGLISARCPAAKKLKGRVTVTFVSGTSAVVPITGSCKQKP